MLIPADLSAEEQRKANEKIKAFRFKLLALWDFVWVEKKNFQFFFSTHTKRYCG